MPGQGEPPRHKPGNTGGTYNSDTPGDTRGSTMANTGGGVELLARVINNRVKGAAAPSGKTEDAGRTRRGIRGDRSVRGREWPRRRRVSHGSRRFSSRSGESRRSGPRRRRRRPASPCDAGDASDRGHRSHEAQAEAPAGAHRRAVRPDAAALRQRPRRRRAGSDEPRVRAATLSDQPGARRRDDAGHALADRAQGYYQQLDQTDAPIAGQEAAIGQLLSDKLGGNATAANTAIAASLKGAQDRAAADEAVRGQIGGSQTAGASSEAQQAGDVVTENTHAAQDAGTASTADFQQLATLARQSRQQAGGEAHTELLNRLANAGRVPGAAHRSRQERGCGDVEEPDGSASAGVREPDHPARVEHQGGRPAGADDARAAEARRGSPAVPGRPAGQVADRPGRSLGDEAGERREGAGQGERHQQVRGLQRAVARHEHEAALAAIRDFTKAAHVPGKGGKGGASAPSAHSVGIVTQVENARNDATTDPKLKNLSGAKLQQRYVKRGCRRCSRPQPSSSMTSGTSRRRRRRRSSGPA
jgi:hypothetical protein